jgi:hypothetical protein
LHDLKQTASMTLVLTSYTTSFLDIIIRNSRDIVVHEKRIQDIESVAEIEHGTKLRNQMGTVSIHWIQKYIRQFI